MPSLIIGHTTEHPVGGTFDGVDNYLRAMGYEPNDMFDPATNQLIEYIAAGTSSKALFNASGGVETNRREQDLRSGADVFQVEIFYATWMGTQDAQWYANLKAYLKWRCSQLSIPYVFPLPHATSYAMAQKLIADGGTRLTFEQWNDPNLRGIIYHANVPENTHWDPTFDPTPLFELAPATPAQENEVELTSPVTLRNTNADTGAWDNTYAQTNVQGAHEFTHFRATEARAFALQARNAANAANVTADAARASANAANTKLDALTAKVDAIQATQASGIDYDLLAEKVADKLAQRLAS